MHSSKSDEIKFAKLFGKSVEEMRKEDGIPDDFRVSHFKNVPLDKIPRCGLYLLIDGAVWEGRNLREQVKAAMDIGEELNANAENKSDATQEIETQKEETPQ